MMICQSCSTELNAPDRFCRNCGAPVASTVGNSADTYRLNNSDPPSAVSQSGSRDLTNPFYAPPAGASPACQSSGSLSQTASLIKNLLRRKLVWLAMFLLLSLVIPIGLTIARDVVRSNRAERAERAREAAQAREVRNARQAEIARRSFEQVVQNALGFLPAAVSPAEYPDIQGIFVAGLTSDISPAALANIQAGDVLVEFNGQAVRNSADLSQILDLLMPHAEVAVKLYRDGVNVATRMRIADKTKPPLQPRTEEKDQGFLGLGNVSRRCCIPDSRKWGLEVRRIIDNSPADLAGLQLGDLIVEFDKQATLTPDEFSRRIHAAKPRTKVKVKFYRGNTEQTVELILGHGWSAEP
ncbi:MAG TPA: PDZ domain-containing protein [Blastocatellia bacterium]|nr:PDZ domain-containing protein [Blastocatellia bacterium]